MACMPMHGKIQSESWADHGEGSQSKQRRFILSHLITSFWQFVFRKVSNVSIRLFWFCFSTLGSPWQRQPLTLVDLTPEVPCNPQRLQKCTAGQLGSWAQWNMIMISEQNFFNVYQQNATDDGFCHNQVANGTQPVPILLSVSNLRFYLMVSLRFFENSMYMFVPFRCGQLPWNDVGFPLNLICKKPCWTRRFTMFHRCHLCVTVVTQLFPGLASWTMSWSCDCEVPDSSKALIGLRSSPLATGSAVWCLAAQCFLMLFPHLPGEGC